jgi:DNA-binding response OmpR family regulator
MPVKDIPIASGRERILIVAQQEALAASLQKLLTDHGYTTEVARNETAAIESVGKTSPSLVLVERALDIPKLRRDPRLRRMAIIALQQPEAHCSEDECLDDLDRGADASMCRVGFKELVARIRAFLRREQILTTPAEQYMAGSLSLDTIRHEVTANGKPVELTPKEFQILQQFVQHPGRVFSREELLDRIWGEGYALEQHTLDVHIHSLRHKIEQDPAKPKYIVTVRGIGYKLRQ